VPFDCCDQAKGVEYRRSSPEMASNRHVVETVSAEDYGLLARSAASLVQGYCKVEWLAKRVVPSARDQ